jgi:hypothetical protein
MEIIADIFTFQCFSVLFQEVLWRLRPFRQLGIIYSLPIRADSEIKFKFIEQELWIVHEELRYELFDISRVSIHAFPLLVDPFE